MRTVGVSRLIRAFCAAAFVLLALADAITQKESTQPKPPTEVLRLGPKPQELSVDQKSDAKRVADLVARLFGNSRKHAKLPHSWRFHCSVMQQAACTSARTGKPQATGHPEFQTIYWTDHPETPSPELEKIAMYDTRPEDRGGFSADRFAVAVWPTMDPKGYWVGIDLHPNPFQEAWIEGMAYLTNCDGPCPKVPVDPACEKVK